MSRILELDGSVLEGGGQILRISVGLSAILGVPVRVINIRLGRNKPGLAAQHLTGIQLVADMCQANLKGASLGSTEIEFIPGKIRGGHYYADCRTAGSISLLLQVALPCALFADATVTLNLKGGTNAEMAPQIDYMDKVFKHVLKQFGANFHLTILRRGYFPKGGGHVSVEIDPVRTLMPLQLTERGTVKEIVGTSFVAGSLPDKLAYLTGKEAQRLLRSEGNAMIRSYKEDLQMAPDNCNGILLSCHLSMGGVLGGDALGKRGVDAEAVGRCAAEALQQEIASGACVDSHTQDQIIIYMALAMGESAVLVGDVTLHTKTAMYIVQKLARVKFNIQPVRRQNLIECTGLAFINKHIPQY